MTATTAQRPGRPNTPVLRDGRPRCPRCDSRLVFEDSEFDCVACGYTYDPFAPVPIDVVTRTRTRGARHEAA